MANKPIDQLVPAGSVEPNDLIPIHQNGVAKKLAAKVLENWLLQMANGHGGIHSIEKVGSNGLVGTYRMTFADTSTFDYVITNGRSIKTIAKTKTSGLTDTYTITYSDNTTSTFPVTNGATGPKGADAHVYFKYASQKPTASSHSMGDEPDNWIGIYSGTAAAAPSDWTQYQWFQFKGAPGNTGAAAQVTETKVEYQAGTSGIVAPSGTWQTSVPIVPQGGYLWVRTTIRFNSGSPVTSYAVCRFGIDGTGSVSSVNGMSPDGNGDVSLDIDISQTEYDLLMNALAEGGG